MREFIFIHTAYRFVFDTAKLRHIFSPLFTQNSVGLHFFRKRKTLLFLFDNMQ